MTQELAKEQKCIVVRGGIHIWIDAERIAKLQTLIETRKGLIEIDGEFINPNDITGILSAQAMEEKTRRANGEWQCQKGKWHNKGERCEGHRYG